MIKNKILIPIVLLALFFGPGCASLGPKQKKATLAHPYWEQEESIQDCLRQKKVCRGMSKDQVQRVLGVPHHVSQYVSALGNTEVWIYGKHPSIDSILYFGREGKLTSISPQKKTNQTTKP